MRKVIFLTTIIICFTSCNKENLTEPRNPVVTNNSNLKTKEVKVFEKGSSTNYLILTLKSENEKLLTRTYKELSDSWVELVEVNPNNPSELLEKRTDETSKADSLGVFYDFNWSNFKFKEKQNKLYFISIHSKIEKTQTLVNSASNLTGFTSNSGYCIVGVQNTDQWFDLGCLCSKSTATWAFHGQPNYSSSPMFSKLLAKNDYLESQTFTTGWNNVASYIMRLNYTGAIRPADAIQTNTIKAGRGIDYWNGGNTTADVRFWMWL